MGTQRKLSAQNRKTAELSALFSSFPFKYYNHFFFCFCFAVLCFITHSCFLNIYAGIFSHLVRIFTENTQLTHTLALTHTQSQLLGRHIRRIQFCRFYRCSPFNGTYAYYFIYFFTVISLHVSLTSSLYCNIQHCPTLPDPKCSVPLSALPNGVLASLTAAAHTQ